MSGEIVCLSSYQRKHESFPAALCLIMLVTAVKLEGLKRKQDLFKRKVLVQLVLI